MRFFIEKGYSLLKKRGVQYKTTKSLTTGVI